MTNVNKAANVEKAAIKFVEHWINGNKRYVYDEIMASTPAVVALLVAYMLGEMNAAQRTSFSSYLEEMV